MATDPYCEAMGDVIEGQRLVCDRFVGHSGQHYDIALQRYFSSDHEIRRQP